MELVELQNQCWYCFGPDVKVGRTSKQIMWNMCCFAFQTRGRTPNTLPGRDLQMERWPSGGRVYQVTHTVHYCSWVIRCTFLSFTFVVIYLCCSPATALRIEHKLIWCFLSVWPARRCLQAQFISSHLELVAYLQLEYCNEEMWRIKFIRLQPSR